MGAELLAQFGCEQAARPVDVKAPIGCSGDTDVTSPQLLEEADKGHRSRSSRSESGSDVVT